MYPSHRGITWYPVWITPQKSTLVVTLEEADQLEVPNWVRLRTLDKLALCRPMTRTIRVGVHLELEVTDYVDPIL